MINVSYEILLKKPPGASSIGDISKELEYEGDEVPQHFQEVALPVMATKEPFRSFWILHVIYFFFRRYSYHKSI